MSLLLLFAGSDGGGGPVLLTFILDLNSRLWLYLRETFFPTIDDLTTMVMLDLRDTQTDAEWTARLYALIADATAAMA